MNRHVLAIFDFSCHITPAEGSRFLVWHESESNTEAFRMFDTERLDVIPYPEMVALEMRGAREAMAWRSGLVAETMVPTGLEDGPQTWIFPDEIANLDELFVLTHSTAYGRTSNGYDKSNVTLWHVQPRASRIDVFPQDWFNNGPYDFMYQGPQIVAREPRSGEIVGSGTRLGIFVLDDTRRAVRTWLSTASR